MLGTFTQLTNFLHAPKRHCYGHRAQCGAVIAVQDYIAWSHGNLNVDNVFFWRDADNKLDLGVLDWGGLGSVHAIYFVWNQS